MKTIPLYQFNLKCATLCCLSLFALHSSFFTLCKAQNVAINATGNQADPSAMLDVSSTSAGVLIPRMSTAQRNLISSPAVGLQVFNTDCNELNFWNGSCWISMGSLPDPLPITSNSSTALCASVTATYTIPVVTGATGYSWTVPAGATINSGQGTTSINVTLGNYSGYICVRAYNACETSNPICLDINVSPIPPTPGNITGLASVSPGQTNVSYFIGSVAGANVYTWTLPSGGTIVTGIGTPLITVNFSCSAVSGSVGVTAGSNCGSSTASLLAVNVSPILAANAGSPVFSGAKIGGSPTATGGDSPYTYSWNPTTNLSSSTAANPIALCSGSTTTYTVTVTDAFGCTATSSVVVTRNLSANAGSAILGGAALNGTATGGVSPYVYSWSPNSNLSSYTVANPTALCGGSTTTYTLTVTDANGCTATSSALATWNLAAGAGSNMTICNGSSAAIGPATATGGNSNSYTYSWNPSTGLSSAAITNPTASPSSTTTYSITVTDANGCTATSSTILTVVPIPSSVFTYSSPSSDFTPVSFTPTATSGVTYSWIFSGGSPGTSTVQNPSVTWNSPGTYTVSLSVTTVSGNCSSTTTTNTITITPTVITFTNVGTTSWTPPSGVTSIQVLVVAGGGGGGWGNGNEGGGGGGGGGLLYSASYSVSQQAYQVTVGAGASETTGSQPGFNGGNSSFGSAVAIGGGGGGGCSSQDGVNGGSGGGGQGCGQDNPPGSATQGNSGGMTGYGNSGGLGKWSGNANGNGGGGGGAGGAGGSGANRANSTAGGAGAGLTYSISGSSVTYAQGGNGGPGKTSANGIDASPANSGNGGTGGNVSGAAGASGVVIIAY